jgi:hypothetical protein
MNAIARRPRGRARGWRACAFAACLGVVGFAATGAAAMSIRELRTLESAEKDGKTYAGYYLVGVMEGLREGAEAAHRAGQPAPFCVEGRRLEPAMARPLYQGELARDADSYEADMPVQLVMAAALRTAYRCTR